MTKKYEEFTMKGFLLTCNGKNMKTAKSTYLMWSHRTESYALTFTVVLHPTTTLQWMYIAIDQSRMQLTKSRGQAQNYCNVPVLVFIVTSVRKAFRLHIYLNTIY